jgi:hypothetical protein
VAPQHFNLPADHLLELPLDRSDEMLRAVRQIASRNRIPTDWEQ